jgi:hypothetical protein
MNNNVLVAGATGNLGGKIVTALLAKGAHVHAIVRMSTPQHKINQLIHQGVTVSQIDTNNVQEVAAACSNMHCVVSALSGLGHVIIDTQKVLFDAAILAKVPRFIPSDFSLDYTNLVPGKNRNLDWRRTFNEYTTNKPIAVTTIFNGAFMELLTGDMPLIILKFKKIIYWSSANIPMDFTTTYNVAEYAASAALDATTPRYLYIAGSTKCPKQIGEICSSLTGQKFKLIKTGSVAMLNVIISIAKLLAPGNNELYPAWQGMQYMRDMVAGRVKIPKYNNDRYATIAWTSIEQYLHSQNINDQYYKN